MRFPTLVPSDEVYENKDTVPIKHENLIRSQ